MIEPKLSFQSRLSSFDPGPLGKGTGEVWKKKLDSDTMLFGVKGTGQHTHVGKDFYVIKNELTGIHKPRV